MAMIDWLIPSHETQLRDKRDIMNMIMPIRMQFVDTFTFYEGTQMNEGSSSMWLSVGLPSIFRKKRVPKLRKKNKKWIMDHNVSVEFREEKLFSPHLLSAQREEE